MNASVANAAGRGFANTTTAPRVAEHRSVCLGIAPMGIAVELRAPKRVVRVQPRKRVVEPMAFAARSQ